MKRVLLEMKAVSWLAHNLHYRAKGESFYSLHLLADKYSFSELRDRLIEVAILGDETVVPTDNELAAELVEQNVGKLEGEVTNEKLIKELAERLDLLSYTTEQVKRDTSSVGGVVSVLDEISNIALTWKNLLNSSL